MYDCAVLCSSRPQRRTHSTVNGAPKNVRGFVSIPLQLFLQLFIGVKWRGSLVAGLALAAASGISGCGSDGSYVLQWRFADEPVGVPFSARACGQNGVETFLVTETGGGETFRTFVLCQDGQARRSLPTGTYEVTVVGVSAAGRQATGPALTGQGTVTVPKDGEGTLSLTILPATEGPATPPAPDGGVDAGVTEPRAGDGTSAGPQDGGIPDAGIPNPGIPDAGVSDPSNTDGGVSDAGALPVDDTVTGADAGPEPTIDGGVGVGG